MISVRLKVSDRIRDRMVRDKTSTYYVKGLNITDKKNGTPAKFPTLNVDSLGEPSTADDLEHKKQNAIISTIELKAYTNTTLTDARNILDKAGDVMISMGYSLIYGPEDISSGDINIMVARFRRTVGAGDIENM